MKPTIELILAALMDNENSLCAAILAAGQSRRFGETDKLVEPLNGKKLGVHICDALVSLNCRRSLVITSAGPNGCKDDWHHRGYETHVNPDAEIGMGTSVALAAKLASEMDADALLICLADMPFVTVSHFRRLIEKFDEGSHPVVASHNGQAALPPAIFGKQLFPELMCLDGHAGARALLSTAECVPAPLDLLMDIDTRDQLAKAQG